MGYDQIYGDDDLDRIRTLKPSALPVGKTQAPFAMSESGSTNPKAMIFHDTARDDKTGRVSMPGNVTDYHVVVDPDGTQHQNAPLNEYRPHAADLNTAPFNGGTGTVGVAALKGTGDPITTQQLYGLSDASEQIGRQLGGAVGMTHPAAGPRATASSKDPREANYLRLINDDRQYRYEGDPGGAYRPRYDPLSTEAAGTVADMNGWPADWQSRQGGDQVAAGPLRRPAGQPVPSPTKVTARSVPTQSIGPGQSPVAPETPIERVAEAARPTRNNSSIATADAPSIKEQIASMTQGLRDTKIPGTDNATLGDTASLFTGAGKGLSAASGMGGMGGLGGFAAALAGGGSDKQAHELEQKAAKDREGTVKSYVEQRKKAAAEAMAALLGKKKQQSPFGVA